ncbi:MAG TPA: hypothetical protein HPP87_03780 [Planctomycetes bacterium]|nr:hypothetical protein [Planctomycetota bacterium]HIJ70465.1 hypothetical protein [Planctomycetota bacterium]
MAKFGVSMVIVSMLCSIWCESVLSAVAEVEGESGWERLAGAPQEVQKAGRVVEKWFEAYLTDDSQRAKEMYHPTRREQAGRNLQQLNKLLEVVNRWRFRPMVIMVSGAESKVISSPMDISDASVLIVHLRKEKGEWWILYWSVDALRQVPGFYPQFRRKYPKAVIWFDEKIDDWLKPLKKTEIDIDIAELFSLPSGEKSIGTLHHKLREVRGEQATFESYFPDSTFGGKILDSWYKADDKKSYSDEEIFTIIRNGFRRSGEGGKRQNKENLIRWVAQHYIRGKEQKNRRALRLMYYASFDADVELVASVVYHGLSVAGDQQDEKVLKRLVDICMSDISTGRILWGTQGKHDKMLSYLNPYFVDSDREIQGRAAILEKVLKGETDYAEWQREQFKKERREQFGDRMGTIREVLLKGSGIQRREVFAQIKRYGLSVLFDKSFVEVLKLCLKDPDPVVKEMAISLGGELLCKAGLQNREMMQLMSELSKDSDSKVRKQAAIFVGSCWICSAKQQEEQAIEIMLRLSKDNNLEVRNSAVYYGLSVAADKSDEVIKRLVDMIVEPNQEDSGQIIRGLRTGADKEKVRAHLQPFIGLRDLKGERARKAYFEIFKEELEAEAVIF